MSKKYININFPFKDSVKGFFLDLTVRDSEAIKSDLIHLILTKKGERYYYPDFGTDLMKFLFEPKDGKTLSDIKFDIKETVKKYLPNLKINDIKIENSKNNDYTFIVTIDYTFKQDVFEQNDFIQLEL